DYGVVTRSRQRLECGELAELAPAFPIPRKSSTANERVCGLSNLKAFFSDKFWLTVGFWPGAEDRALRGRNLSAVFRTLYRQVGKPCKGLASCAQIWRVENQCDKSIRPKWRWFPVGPQPLL